jgi:hypothetical protein
MNSDEKFTLLRRVLKSLGLSTDAIDDIFDRITDFLSGHDNESRGESEYPYCQRDSFLSPAEYSFFMVLQAAVQDSALVETKVNLADVFYTKSSDPSKYRIYTNKIDRKHIDFLLCHPKTVRPIVGIELDDKSHQREDRQVRDTFVENVFRTANLPLIRIPARNAYSVAELTSLLQPFLSGPNPTPSPVSFQPEQAAPWCPKCGAPMVLRTAKSGVNEGQMFWGCSNFPKCRGIVPYKS